MSINSERKKVILDTTTLIGVLTKPQGICSDALIICLESCGLLWGKLISGNVDDCHLLRESPPDITGKGYLSRRLKEDFAAQGIDLLTKVRRNMPPETLS